MNEEVAGMGAVVAPVVSPVPGVPSGGSGFNQPGSGSGDIHTPFTISPFKKYIALKPKVQPIKKKKKKNTNINILPFKEWKEIN